MLPPQGLSSLPAGRCRRTTTRPIWRTSGLTSTPAWASSSEKTGCWPRLTATYRECWASPLAPETATTHSTSVILEQRQCSPHTGYTRQLWQTPKIFLVVTTELGVGRTVLLASTSEERPGQGHCWGSYDAQDRPHDTELSSPQMSIVLPLKSPVPDIMFFSLSSADPSFVLATCNMNAFQKLRGQ